MPSPQRSYIIVGAGVFGVSTAYHLIRKYPSASVTLVDRDAYDAASRVAASWDWNKVVRADYDDLVYCRLALESQDIFLTEDLWKPFFHRTGIYWMCRDDYAGKVIQNYEALGRKAELSAVPVEEAKRLYGGLFADADFQGVKAVLVNKTSGWAAAGDCLRAVTKDVIRLGVRYVAAEVESLAFDGNGRCTGVSIPGGKTLEAQHVILSTGAFTAKLLEQSATATGNLNLRAGDRITAAGITTGMVKLDKRRLETYASMPVGMQGYTAQIGTFIGSLPPTPDGELKWWGQTIFRNTQEIYPGRHVSIPPPKQDYAQWEIPQRLRRDIERARDVFYGPKSRDWKVEKHRICWDAFTTSGDFIISPHSGAPAGGLYIATCGNFHGWKFFPVLGKYVLQMLEGALEPSLREKWSWDRERPDPSRNPDWPRAEMGSLLQGVETAML